LEKKRLWQESRKTSDVAIFLWLFVVNNMKIINDLLFILNNAYLAGAIREVVLANIKL